MPRSHSFDKQRVEVLPDPPLNDDMPLRLACDLDGTLVDMEIALQREAERLFGEDTVLRAPGPVMMPRSDVEADLSLEATGSPSPQPSKKTLTDSQMRALWTHVRRIPDFWVGLDEIEPGAVARLSALAVKHRFEVIFVTQRPSTAGETVQRQSQRWLAAHGFDYPSVYVVNGSRGKLADALALHAVVDDRPENCLDVKTDSTARPLLLWRDRPALVPPIIASLGIEVVFGMTEALERLEAMTRVTRRGVLGRIGAAWPFARPRRLGSATARPSVEPVRDDRSA